MFTKSSFTMHRNNSIAPNPCPISSKYLLHNILIFAPLCMCISRFHNTQISTATPHQRHKHQTYKKYLLCRAIWDWPPYQFALFYLKIKFWHSFNIAPRFHLCAQSISAATSQHCICRCEDLSQIRAACHSKEQLCSSMQIM